MGESPSLRGVPGGPPWPAPYARESDWQRFHQQDLPGLTAEGLWRARHHAERALAGLTPQEAHHVVDATAGLVTAGQWLRQRLTAIRKEEGVRGYR
jgi:hypothetical protein